MLIRWMETLASFNFEVEFRRGTAHGNADALSRIEHVDTNGQPLTVNELDDAIQDLVPDQIAATKATEDEDQYFHHLNEDSTLSTVKQWITENKTPSKRNIKGKGIDIARYHELANLLFVKDGKVYLKWRNNLNTTSERLCIPKGMQKTIVTKFHEHSHKGITQTSNTLKARFFFPGMTELCRSVVTKCLVCQRLQGQPKPQKHTLEDTMSDKPWHKLAID